MSREPPDTVGERRLLELLPWFVNGTLGEAEREEVRRALRSSLGLRREHDRLVRLQQLMRENDAEQAAADRGFGRLMKRIERRRPWRQAALWQAAAVLLLAVGVALWWNRDRGARFETLTAPDSAIQLRVAFAPDVAGEAREAILAAHGLAIAIAPREEGVYTLQVPPGADARAIADALRADPRIAFASTPPASEAR